MTADEAKDFANREAAVMADAVKARWAQPADLLEPDFHTVRDRADFQKLQDELEAKTSAADLGPLHRGR